jgi:hypothetical protein
VRRIGAEADVPTKAYDLIAAFSRELPERPIADVVSAFAMTSEIQRP